MTAPEFPVQLVLDGSAVRAYLAGGGVAVGEALALTLDDGAAFGIHVTTLVTVEVARGAGDMSVTLLMNHAAFRPLTVTAADYDPLVRLTGELGALEPAMVMLSAGEHDALVLTADGAAYSGLKDRATRDRIIEFDPGD